LLRRVSDVSSDLLPPGGEGLSRPATKEAQRVKQAVEKLEQNSRTYGTIKLENAPVASYRYRVGNYRLLFDIDDEAKVIEILDIRKRDERTYK